MEKCQKTTGSWGSGLGFDPRRTDSSPGSVPLGLLDLGLQISQGDGELVIDFL